MRAVPTGLARADPAQRAVEAAVLSAITHADPRCVDSCVAYCHLVRRHFALRHRLHAGEAGEDASGEWIAQRVAHHSQVAGLVAMEVVCDALRYSDLTGRPVPATMWGDADYPLGLIFVRADQAKATTDLIVVHEVAHHRWASYGHRQIFLDRCQELIDAAAPRSPLTSATPAICVRTARSQCR